ncbi:hypothetical protein GCM10009747_01280 [Agromyces humatus]|uniref:Uncharacterized protein n=1 Tax=Agromyces humatus TaxID=279573 RepID=A0ABN2K4J0_9MICO
MLRAETDRAGPAQALARGDDLTGPDVLAVAVKGPGQVHAAPFAGEVWGVGRVPAIVAGGRFASGTTGMHAHLGIGGIAPYRGARGIRNFESPSTNRRFRS